MNDSGRGVRVKISDYEAIVAHSREALPNEACGLLAGRVEDGVKIIEKVYFMTNVDASGEHFSIDPREQLAAVKDMRANGLVPLGNFHSHPATPARPSEEDIRLAHDPSASYLILSLAEQDGVAAPFKGPVLRAFHIEAQTASSEKIETRG
jgi:proteasome lid subunit RPN8/RPN11